MFLRFSVLGLLLMALAAGCGAQQTDTVTTEASHEDHDHDHEHGHDHSHDHDHEHAEPAKTLEEAVTQIETARNTIRDGLAAGEKQKADGALHDLGHVLEHIPSLTKDLAEDTQA